jgi:hypothetical protein
MVIDGSLYFWAIIVPYRITMCVTMILLLTVVFKELYPLLLLRFVDVRSWFEKKKKELKNGK